MVLLELIWEIRLSLLLHFSDFERIDKKNPCIEFRYKDFLIQLEKISTVRLMLS